MFLPVSSTNCQCSIRYKLLAFESTVTTNFFFTVNHNFHSNHNAVICKKRGQQIQLLKHTLLIKLKVQATRIIIFVAISRSAVRAGDAAVSLALFFWAKLIRFGQIWLDLGKIKILHLPKHSISYGYGYKLKKQCNVTYWTWYHIPIQLHEQFQSILYQLRRVW